MSSESEKRAVAISTNYRWLWFALGVLCALVMLTGFGALAQAGLLGVGLAVWSTVHLAPLLGFAMGLVSTTWYAVITAVSGLTALAMLREFWQPGYLWGRLSKLWRARKVQRNLKRSFKMTFGDRVEDQSRMLFDGWMRKMWPGFACGKKPKSVTLPIFASIEIVVSLWTIVESPFVDENDFGYAVGLLFLSVLELVLNPFQALLSVLDIVENLVNQ